MNLAKIDGQLAELRSTVEGIDDELRQAERTATAQGKGLGDQHSTHKDLLPIYWRRYRVHPQETEKEMNSDHRLKHAGWQLRKQFSDELLKIIAKANEGRDQWWRQYQLAADYHADGHFDGGEYRLPLIYFLHMPTDAVGPPYDIMKEFEQAAKRFGRGWKFVPTASRNRRIVDVNGFTLALTHPINSELIAKLMEMPT